MKTRYTFIILLLAVTLASSAQEPRFKISLAEWSLNKSLFKKTITNMDFPRIAKETYGLDAVEYVSTFFRDKAEDTQYLTQLKNECEKYGVKSLLIMVDGEGNLADTSATARNKAVENHYKWVKAAKFLGCHTIRVNAGGRGTMGEMQAAAIESLTKLSAYAADYGINVVVENHGGNSSYGKWLAEIMKSVNKPNCGTLPDLGNFYEYDRYKGVTELMPYAKGVSAKTHDFDANGNETQIDYEKMMKIIADSGFKGYIDVEYEGTKLSEDEGIKATIALLKRVIEPYNK
ncbi:MAG TPA: sugar phosphate isomerase/epimerase family protein [Bacteroidales bacterium]|jgi:sugar phosphate isomerase/epimerase|nr:sugar phosphate isomerase/epimerase family protein [Bacteroidales bacterium]